MTGSKGVVSLAELIQNPPACQAAFIEPSLLPHQGILFVGGEPKVGKSLLVTNLALCLASGDSKLGFPIPKPARVLICQFELPPEQFAVRLLLMRHGVGAAADQRLLVDTHSFGKLLSTSQGLAQFVQAARAAQAQVIVLDPLYAAHDRDENDTHAMAALCQNLLHLREHSQASLIVVHHVRKSAHRSEIGTAFRGSSALHAVGDSYLLLSRSSPQGTELDLRFQFRYAAAPAPRRLCLDPQTLWFSPSASAASNAPSKKRKVDNSDVQNCFVEPKSPLRFNQLRQELMKGAQCSNRTAQLAIQRACDEGAILRQGGLYRLPM